MPGPQRQLLNHDMVCRKMKKKSDFSENQANTMRKIRVICIDPDATDSSSEDEDGEYKKKTDLKGFKRVIREIKLPIKSILSDFDTETSSQESNIKTKSRKSSSKRRVSKSPSSVLDVSTSKGECKLAKSIKPELGLLEEPLFPLLDFDSFCLEYFEVLDDRDFVGLEDLPFCSLSKGEENDFSAMDFDLDVDSLAWINL
ncbi:uncharacterized protein LOC143846343 [Tasmannia lanceolata]|uniref:uncharacterized protein LOC143846343 n=1 Tax=Tasmannia lanceolata TaxID=3420 RepID=UPI004063A5A7